VEISYRIDFPLKKLNGHQLNCWVKNIFIWQGSKSKSSDWFFLGRDLYGNGLNGSGLKLLIFLFQCESRQIQNLQPKLQKETSSAKKLLKD